VLLILMGGAVVVPIIRPRVAASGPPGSGMVLRNIVVAWLFVTAVAIVLGRSAIGFLSKNGAHNAALGVFETFACVVIGGSSVWLSRGVTMSYRRWRGR
jgi:hypothetical protein